MCANAQMTGLNLRIVRVSMMKPQRSKMNPQWNANPLDAMEPIESQRRKSHASPVRRYLGQSLLAALVGFSCTLPVAASPFLPALARRRAVTAPRLNKERNRPFSPVQVRMVHSCIERILSLAADTIRLERRYS
jgi:hypothetical protein